MFQWVKYSICLDNKTEKRPAVEKESSNEGYNPFKIFAFSMEHCADNKFKSLIYVDKDKDLYHQDLGHILQCLKKTQECLIKRSEQDFVECTK